jgi:hypothetical protein
MMEGSGAGGFGCGYVWPKTTKLILLDSLLQEVEDFAPTLCFR